MSENKNNPNVNVKDQGQHKGNCDSQQPQSCDKEDKAKGKDTQKAESQSNVKKNPEEQNTEHKHGGSCSH